MLDVGHAADVAITEWKIQTIQDSRKPGGLAAVPT